ncbi:hypothetical protein JHC43_02850 [Marinobacter salarius]|uniref:alpha/beta fold hydrolase n=1 Tax=Marinobacter salarius TaxID=1420917 RepID=UPI0018F278B4|nr:CocE/NonD family hydrolase [Marinobacter salarius]MBJ7275395.1 hypothetical protein [Marinobacter salarius]
MHQTFLFRFWFRHTFIAILALTVVGCGGASSDTDTDAQAQSQSNADAARGRGCGNAKDGAPSQCKVPPHVSCRNEAPVEGGNSYPVKLTSASGETIAFQVLEPLGEIACGEGHPLVLHGHGFGGSRTTEGFQNYREAGFVVISIDQRGFGESTGTVRVMDPEFEGEDLIQILDWAEANLDYLRYRDEPELPDDLNPNLVAGAIGGSYGGGYQILIHGQDPRRRLDALVPDITWYDLRYSLNPGNVIKTGWDLVLVAGGEAGSTGQGNGGLDPIIRETLARGATLNRFPEAGLDFIYYHSPAYRCTGEPVFVADDPDLLNYQIDPPAYDVAPTPFAEVDVLLTQGMRDTLFNFNEAWRNFECLKASGGDVRLLTHQTGHILPAEAPDEAQPAEYVDPTADLLELPGFQAAGGQFSCGDISVSDATLNWLEHHLLGRPLASYFDGTDSEVCLSLDDGESISVPMEAFPAPDLSGGELQGEFMVERAVATVAPVASGYEAAATATQPPAALVLGQAGANGATLGGIPTARLTVSDLAGRADCEVELDPYAPGCDPIVFIGLGKRGVGESRWQLIDDQIKPVRGLKNQEVIELVGIGEALASGDELAMLVYGFNPQFPASWSRDALVPFVNLEGTVQLPVLEGSLTNPL